MVKILNFQLFFHNRKSLSPSLPRIIDANVTDTSIVQEMELLPAVSSQRCVEENTLISGAVIFLVIQVIILTMFVFLWKKKRENQAKEVITPPESTTDSLSYMYESGFARRLH